MHVLDCLAAGFRPTKRNGTNEILWAMGVGIAAGFLSGILFAPETGKKTREVLVKNGKVLANRVRNSLSEAESVLADALSDAQDAIENGSV